VFGPKGRKEIERERERDVTGSLQQTDRLQNLCRNGRIILKLNVMGQNVRPQAGLIFLGTGAGGRLWCTQ
jgi:hypothetical protein